MTPVDAALYPDLFCLAVDADGHTACDRAKGHKGPHSWEPWQ
jgi:hypothetical protein